MASAACTRKATATEEYPAHYKGVKALVDGGADTIPELYVRPPDDHPVIDSPELQIPLIDLCDLDGPRRAAVVEAIGDACRDWGFFLVKNHGVPSSVMEEEMRVGKEFFHQPAEEKMKYFSTDPKSRMRYGTSFNLEKDKVLNWRDFLRYSCRPSNEMWNLWPDKPADFRSDTYFFQFSEKRRDFKLQPTISVTLNLISIFEPQESER
eukprot:TRINITY_DN814_c0_g1_i2.p1 TRINITY_DN814_c0_g1~~TRINITY_DN814_c0_g1_i2.p1  ORF type:complete len:208 (+),score=21.19 TRINITY_DN814_c0_g1_i2:322-945(+)